MEMFLPATKNLLSEKNHGECKRWRLLAAARKPRAGPSRLRRRCWRSLPAHPEGRITSPVCLSRRCPAHVRRPPHRDVREKPRHAGPLQKGTAAPPPGVSRTRAHAFAPELCVTFRSPFLRPRWLFRLDKEKVVKLNVRCRFCVSLLSPAAVSLPRSVQTAPEAPPPHSPDPNVILKLSESE